MDGVVSDEVIKRRLPPWMLGVAAADKGGVGDPKNNNNNGEIDDGCGSREDEERVKKRGGRRPKSKVATQKKRDDFSDGLELEEAEEEKEESSTLAVKCGDRKRTKRKLNLDAEDASKKKMRKGRAKRNIQSREDATTGTGGCLQNGEDEDLTVEDLMIFAKECVQEDIGAQEVESGKEEISAENQFVDIVQSGNSIDVQENKSSSGIATGNVNVTSEGSGFKPSMSGDPTQDMLDLFLGPLLKKTQEKEKKVDLAAEEMDFNFEMKRQNTSAALGEEQATVTVTRKKSSLRDKVAMFLD